MLKMSESTRAFLEKNCPATLGADNISDALEILYDDIEEKGFGGEHYDEYNEYGRKAQKAYDDLYLSNPKQK